MITRNYRRLTRLALLVFLLFALAACGADTLPTPTTAPVATVAETPTPQPTDEMATAVPPTATPMDNGEGDMGSNDPIIESIAVYKEDDGRVQIVVTGQMRDACTEVADTRQEFDLNSNTFHVELMTNRPADAVCAEVLTAFEQLVTLQTAELNPGAYTVTVQDRSETFELTAADQQPNSGSISITPEMGPAGAMVQLTASGLPANSQVELGVGLANSEYDIVDTAQTNANGELTAAVQIPESAQVGDEWNLVIEGPSGAKTISNEFAVTESDSTGNFEEANIYLIALEDGGESGEEIGCGDSAAPVTVNFEPTVAPLTAALEELLSIDEEYYGQSGLYNALHNADLNVEGINIVNQHATIALSGELSLGGTCDSPRVAAQLEQTALQYSTIDSVSITLNGDPLSEALSAAGS